MTLDLERVILVIGSCSLDRLLAVETYPAPDSKVRSTNYYENGGGNAANTAHTMALLSKASLFIGGGKNQNIKFTVKLCTKIGSDESGVKLIKELDAAGVDLTSPLFMVGNKRESTAVTTVIVSETEHTRTCIHTPGTCGELDLDDLKDIDMDEVFSGTVVLLHSDGRHTDAALKLAREANKRGIPVSVDVEKDRHCTALDDLMEEADLIFTDSQQMEAYLDRLNREHEEEFHQMPLETPHVVIECNSVESISRAEAKFLAKAIEPSTYFTRWSAQTGKQIVITKGNQGALRITTKSTEFKKLSDPEGKSINQIEISKQNHHFARVRQSFTNIPSLASDSTNAKQCLACYHIHTVGVLKGLKVVDTTGAGDAFMGAYLMAILGKDHLKLDLTVHQCLQFATWVAGRKVQGIGARTALPTEVDVNGILGINAAQVKEYLVHIIDRFHVYSE